MSQSSQTRFFSALNHYNDARVIKWVWRQAVRRFQGVSGGFDD